MGRTQIETVETIVENPRFTIDVDGTRVRVTRLGIVDGETHWEIATGIDGDFREVFPTDRGYIKNGECYCVTGDSVILDSVNWEYEHVGSVDHSALRVGDSVGAELTELNE